MKMLTSVAAACGLAALSIAGAAQAASLTADQILNQFNLVTFGDVTGSSEVEGRTLIGGNLAGSGANFYIKGADVTPSDYDGLHVGGNVSGGYHQINNAGDAYIAGDVQNMNMNGGVAYIGGGITGNVNGTRHTGQSVTIPDFEALLKATSAELSGMTGVGPQISGARAVFDAPADATGRTFFSIDGSDFDAWGELIVRAAADSTVIINVSGADIAFRENMIETDYSLGSLILWNFYEAARLELNTKIIGAVLAPYAAVTLGNPVEGSLVAQSLLLSSEVHLQPFEGTTIIPLDPAPPVGKVPLPGALPLLLAGLGALGVATRRRG
jgi:choice-of-anchor A domain-containing protein